MKHVNVVIGSGSIGQAIARRVSIGKHVLLADLHEKNAVAAAKTLSDAGYEVSTAIVDIADRRSIEALVKKASSIGPVTGMIHAAGVSPSGIVMTPLANDELSGPRGAGYRRMIEQSVSKRAGTPDEVAAVAALLMGPDGTFISGSDFLMDGGVTATYRFGGLAEVNMQPGKGP